MEPLWKNNNKTQSKQTKKRPQINQLVCIVWESQCSAQTLSMCEARAVRTTVRGRREGQGAWSSGLYMLWLDMTFVSDKKRTRAENEAPHHNVLPSVGR